jgi:hypothetical protein
MEQAIVTSHGKFMRSRPPGPGHWRAGPGPGEPASDRAVPQAELALRGQTVLAVGGDVGWFGAASVGYGDLADGPPLVL